MERNKRTTQGFQPLSHSISQAAKDLQLEDQLLQQRVFSHWHSALRQLRVEGTEQTLPTSFSHGKLTVACLSRELAIRLSAQFQEILAELNGLLGRKLVFAIAIET